MDLKKIASSLLSSDSISGLSDLTGASGSDITKVLTSALPSLLSGATEQAKNKDTAESFTKALAQHAKDDTSSLKSFLGNVDLSDGAKILTHLLGSDKDSTVKAVAKETGVSQSKTSSILSAVAPMLLSLLGQQTDTDDNKDSGVGALVGTLLDNVDVGSLLSGLISTDTSSDSSAKKDSKKKAASDKSGAGNIIGGILSGLLKK